MKATRVLGIAVLLALLGRSETVARPLSATLADLQTQLTAAVHGAPGRVGIAIEDLRTGAISGVNAEVSMPAASTIKIPVMVEVFRQMSLGTIDLTRPVSLRAGDKDWGWGDLADARIGSSYTVSRLLWTMITDSDNTATNMLIRLVGRAHINTTMHELGLRHTTVANYIRSNGDIRSLRSSPTDMVRLLDAMARYTLIDEWSSRQMVAILSGQHHNSLLPQPLPAEARVAHKTGTLHDTLNDVGIVYSSRDPYVIAVMTTRLPTLDLGRRFIRGVSRIAYDAMARFADRRDAEGIEPLDRLTAPTSPDVPMWMGNPAVAAPIPVATAAPSELPEPS